MQEQLPGFRRIPHYVAHSASFLDRARLQLAREQLTFYQGIPNSQLRRSRPFPARHYNHALHVCRAIQQHAPGQFPA